MTGPAENTQPTPRVIICFDLSKSCWNCEARLPREPIEGRYCTVGCYDEARERREHEAARLACCPECGYDRQEHNPTCSRATARDIERESSASSGVHGKTE